MEAVANSTQALTLTINGQARTLNMKVTKTIQVGDIVTVRRFAGSVQAVVTGVIGQVVWIAHPVYGEGCLHASKIIKVQGV